MQRVVILFVHFHWPRETANATFDCAALLILWDVIRSKRPRLLKNDYCFCLKCQVSCSALEPSLGNAMSYYILSGCNRWNLTVDRPLAAKLNRQYGLQQGFKHPYFAYQVSGTNHTNRRVQHRLLDMFLYKRRMTLSVRKHLQRNVLSVSEQLWTIVKLILLQIYGKSVVLEAIQEQSVVLVKDHGK
jgi:hypothetical protein